MARGLRRCRAPPVTVHPRRRSVDAGGSLVRSHRPPLPPDPPRPLRTLTRGRGCYSAPVPAAALRSPLPHPSPLVGEGPGVGGSLRRRRPLPLQPEPVPRIFCRLGRRGETN